MERILSKNSDGSIDILDDFERIEYTVRNNENGIIAKLAKKLLLYEELFAPDKLNNVLSNYFDIGDETYAYNLTRAKSAFTVGTVTIDDFEEFDEETVNDLADYIRKELTE